MNTIIDADAAKLAGLQIDLLQKVRQGHVTLGQLEWFTGLSKEERNNLFLSSRSSLLEFVSTVVVPANTCKFVAREGLVCDVSVAAAVKIRYLSENFIEWFLGGRGKIEAPMTEQVLRYAKLRKPSFDGAIIAELGGEAKAETALREMFFLMKKQGHGQPGVLLNNAYANIFYVRDIAGALRTVRAYWYGGGWSVHAYSVGSPNRWDDGPPGVLSQFCPWLLCHCSGELILWQLDTLTLGLHDV